MKKERLQHLRAGDLVLFYRNEKSDPTYVYSKDWVERRQRLQRRYKVLRMFTFVCELPCDDYNEGPMYNLYTIEFGKMITDPDVAHTVISR